MNLKARLFIFMLGIFIVFTSVIWIYTGSIFEQINKEWAKRFIQKQVIFDKSRTLLPILKELKLVKAMAQDPDIIAMALHVNDPKYRQKGIDSLEKHKLKFHDRSYFAAFTKSHEYFYNNSSNEYSNNQKRYVLSKDKLDDSWFFYTLSKDDTFQVNVNKDSELNVVKIWIDYVLNLNGEKLGVLGTGFDFDEFLKNSVGLEQQGVRNFFVNKDLAIQLARDTKLIDYASMTKEDGQHKTIDLFLSDIEDISAIKSTMQELFKNPNEVRSLLVTFEGKKQLLGIAYLQEIDWFSLTLIDTNELSLINQPALVPILSFLFLISLFFVGYALNVVILSPIAQLKEMMKRIEDGEYHLQASIVGKAEIADLSKQFQTMVQFIQNYNAQLENKVKERTLELEHSQECIKQLAFYDPLTNLPNRRLLSERFYLLLAQIKRNANHGALLMLDLDDFKPINDRYGHLAGDELLKQIAQRLKSCIRENDTVARFGGDEFSILLDSLEADASLAQAQSIKIAQKIQDTLNKPYQITNTVCTCSLSIGITLISKDDHNIEQIFERADQAMYTVKQSSKNGIHFFS